MNSKFSLHPAGGSERVRSRLIARPRLLAEMRTCLDVRAFLVVAPAGSGKSTLLEQAISELGVLSVLAPLTPAHADPVIFCRSIAGGLRARKPHLGGRALAAIEAGLDARGVVSALMLDLADVGEPMLLAFDDLHLLEEGSGHPRYSSVQALSAMLMQPGLDNLHVVLSSRNMPALRLSRLSLAGELKGLGQDALAFDVNEVREYLEKIRKAPVSLADATSALEATAGWAAGLVLTEAQPSQGLGRSRTDPANVFDYLDEEVLPSLPPELRQFAIECAALGELTAQLCDFALERNDSFERLRELERRNLFVLRSSSERRDALRFHSLFREFLSSRYLDPGRAMAIRRKAAQFHAIQHDWLEAIGHARAAEDWDGLTTLLSERGRMLVDAGYVSIVRSTLQEIEGKAPLPVQLTILYAETLIRGSDAEAAEALLSGLGNIPRELAADVAILRARAARIGGRNAECIEIAEEELRQARCSTSQEAMLHRFAALGYSFVGKHSEAQSHDLLALKRFEADGNGVEAASTKCSLGISYYLQGDDYTKAEKLFRQARKAFVRAKRPDYLAMALNNLASVVLVTGRVAEAIGLLVEAREIVLQSADHFWRAEIAHTLGEAYRVARDNESSLQAFDESMKAAWDAGSTYREQSAMLWMAIGLLDAGRHLEAERLLKLVREDDSLVKRLKPLDQLVRLRAAWLEQDYRSAVQHAVRLLLLSQEADQQRFVRFARLFLVAALALSNNPDAEVSGSFRALIGDAGRLQDALALWPDVAQVVISTVEQLPGGAAYSRGWRSALDRVRLDQSKAPTLASASQKRPSRIEILALQESPRIIIDGVPFTKGWRRRAALEVLLYLVHYKTGGADMADQILEESTTPGQVQKRFHIILDRLRDVLGRDAIVHDGVAWPRRYRLHEEIEVVYDVEQFTRLARSILSAPSHPSQIPGIQAARSIRAAEYWIWRDTAHSWAEPIHQEVEQLYFELLGREIELARQSSLSTVRELERLRSSVTESTGIGLRQLLD